MKIGIANDHHGIELKARIIDYLRKHDIKYINYGCDEKNNVDYIDYAVRLSHAVVNGSVDLGILICGTGIGMSIAANKVKGIICGHCSNVEQAHLTREHNHANIIAISYKQPVPEIVEMIREFLKTEPSKEERHNRRVNKILDYEKAR